MKRYALIGLLSVLLSIMLSFEAYAQTFVTLTYRGATRVYGQKRIDDSKEMESILQLVQNGQPLESGVNIDVRNGGPVIELLVEDEQNGVLDFTLYTIYPGIPENVGYEVTIILDDDANFSYDDLELFQELADYIMQNPVEKTIPDTGRGGWYRPAQEGAS